MKKKVSSGRSKSAKVTKKSTGGGITFSPCESEFNLPPVFVSGFFHVRDLPPPPSLSTSDVGRIITEVRDDGRILEAICGHLRISHHDLKQSLCHFRSYVSPQWSSEDYSLSELREVVPALLSNWPRQDEKLAYALRRASVKRVLESVDRLCSSRPELPSRPLIDRDEQSKPVHPRRALELIEAWLRKTSKTHKVDRLVTISEIANLMIPGLKRRTLERWQAEGKLPSPVVKSQRGNRWSFSELTDAIKALKGVDLRAYEAELFATMSERREALARLNQKIIRK